MNLMALMVLINCMSSHKRESAPYSVILGCEPDLIIK